MKMRRSRSRGRKKTLSLNRKRNRSIKKVVERNERVALEEKKGPKKVEKGPRIRS